MRTFISRVVDDKGKRSTLIREGAHEGAIIRDLNQEGYYILSVKTVDQDSGQGLQKVSPKAVLEFTQILMTLSSNGLKLKEALSIAKRLGSPLVNPLLIDIEARVAKGSSLYDALSAWKRSFSSLYLGLIRIGEKTGDLSAIFKRLSDYLVGRQALREKTISALIYPAFVMAIAILGAVLLVTLVLPGLSGMVSSLNPKAALLYQTNLKSFQFNAAVFLVVLMLCLLGVWRAFSLRHHNPAWALRLDSFILKVPLAGSFRRSFFGFNFSFAMETLLSSGYPLEEALEESSLVIDNRLYRKAMLNAREGITKQGLTFSQALKNERVFPPILVDWMAVGEGAQDLIGSFGQVRAFYQKETERLFSGFMGLIEPALIVVVGIVMLVMILNFITPIFTMMGNLL